MATSDQLLNAANQLTLAAQGLQTAVSTATTQFQPSLTAAQQASLTAQQAVNITAASRDAAAASASAALSSEQSALASKNAAAVSAAAALVSEQNANISEDIAVAAANYKGEYSAGTTYLLGESVSYLGGRYLVKVVSTTGVLPTDPTNWLRIAFFPELTGTENQVLISDGEVLYTALITEANLSPNVQLTPDFVLQQAGVK